jgi:beta-glucosidase/6-phospho-beta-glucosidase/beta-galactosidase
LKDILVQAAIAGIKALKSVEPRCRIVSAEPLINVIPRSQNQEDVQFARQYTLAQFEALDLISGRSRPELGGNPEYVDIIGLNYYIHNQWMDGDLPISVDHPEYRPFSELAIQIHNRYGAPIFVAETGIEGDVRADWLRIMGSEVQVAQCAGVPVEGICVYPITDYPGWDDERECPTGLVSCVARNGGRTVYAPLARELSAQQNVRVPILRSCE